jgi:hypothetical protein
MPAPSAMALCSAAKLDCEIAVLAGDCHVDDARNLLVAIFLQDTQCEQLLFIDADTFVEDLSAFIEIDEPVVCAAIPKKNDMPAYACNALSGPIQADARGLIEVFDCGTGVMKIQRHVLERLYAHEPKFTYDGRPVAQVFNRDVVDGKRMSGDLNFCRKWRALGGRIMVDPELRVSHTGEKTWQGSYGSYLRAANGLGLTRGIERIRSGAYVRADAIELCEEWGNPLYAAGVEFLTACIEVAQQAQGRTIVEAGSGLTSLCMAAAGADVHALEHDPVWFAHTRKAQERLGLDTLTLHYAPLMPHGERLWYGEIAASFPWRDAAIVVCDGPPSVYGDRLALYSTMREAGARPRLILQDDIGTPEELAAVAAACPAYSFERMGALRGFAVGRPR